MSFQRADNWSVRDSLKANVGVAILGGSLKQYQFSVVITEICLSLSKSNPFLLL